MLKHVFINWNYVYIPDLFITHQYHNDATARRVRELGDRDAPVNIPEDEWKQKRFVYNLPESFLDQPQAIEKFEAYETIVRNAVEQEKLDNLTGANKIGRYNPKLAAVLQ